MVMWASDPSPTTLHKECVDCNHPPCANTAMAGSLQRMVMPPEPHRPSLPASRRPASSSLELREEGIEGFRVKQMNPALDLPTTLEPHYRYGVEFLRTTVVRSADTLYCHEMVVRA